MTTRKPIVLIDGKEAQLPNGDTIPFDNSTNGFVSDNIQGAIEEVNAKTVIGFNINSILTHQYNSAGTILMTYDSASNTHIKAGPQIITDSNGNLIMRRL